jgi:hypothetical protein
VIVGKFWFIAYLRYKLLPRNTTKMEVSFYCSSLFIDKKTAGLDEPAGVGLFSKLFESMPD